MDPNRTPRSLAARLREDQDGFSLIELMVVVLVIAILMGIAIPVYLGLRARAADRVAQTAVVGVLKAEVGYFSAESQEFTDSVAVLESIEPALNYDGQGADSCLGTPNPYCVKVELLSPEEVILTVLSESGVYWSIRDKRSAPDQGTFFNAGGDGVAPQPGDIVDDAW